MHLRQLSLFVPLLLAAVVVTPSAQSSKRPGVVFVKPPADLLPELIALTVRDAKSGAAVSHALICLEGKDHWAITNEFGHGRVGNLPRGARRARVEALGFAPESLIVDATRDDRRAAVIRLRPRKETRATLSCD